MANIIGTNGNDTLVGSNNEDTINGKAGNDNITASYGNDTVTGGGGKDTFVYSLDNLYNYDIDIITDFGGIGKGTKPTEAIIADVDTIKLQGDILTARNLLLTQNGSNLDITFEGVLGDAKLILQNFALENLDNLSKSTGATVDLGNILFNGQTTITDSFDVFNANSTQSTIFNKNTVTFLNDLGNNVNGFDNSDDVINGQGGDDIIDGLNGNDLLRGGTGNDALNGGAGNDTLNGGAGNNTLNGGAGNDTLNADSSSGNNLFDGGNNNDFLSFSGSSGKNTLNGGAGDDTLNAYSSSGDNLLSGGDGNDSLSISAFEYYYPGDRSFAKNTLNGGVGDDTLSTSGLSGDNLLSGGDGNDSLNASNAFGNNTLNGGNGDDIFIGGSGGGNGNDILTGGDGNDKFVYNDLGYNSTDTITDFGGIGKGVSPSAAVIAEVDTLIFQGADLTAQNLLLTQNGNNLEISFAVGYGKLILQNFALENLDNLSKSTGATVDLGNILFYGQNSITDSFDVFNANSTQSTIFNKNTVTFLNDLDNNVSGFDNSGDVINGQGGDDIIDGLSGNDLLRGGAGNNTLNGGTGEDNLNVDSLLGNNLLNGGDGNDSLFASGNQDYLGFYQKGNDLRILGNNTLNGGAGDDTLDASGSTGDNLLSGGDGNDSVSVSGYYSSPGGDYSNNYDSRSSGNNTLNGGAGDDTVSASGSSGNNLLSGDDGNDSLDISGFPEFNYDSYFDSVSSGNNTLNGGAGDDTLNASGSKGDNLLNGGDGNDSFYTAVSRQSFVSPPSSSVIQTLDGGKGNDFLSADFGLATVGITSTFNTSTNIGSITDGTNSVNYTNIERLKISGTDYNDNIVGNSGNDTLSTGTSGQDTIDGGTGNDVLSFNYIIYNYNSPSGITSTYDASTNIGSITVGTSSVTYTNIERLNISDTFYDDNIVGNSGNDTLSTGNGGKDTIDGGTGDDVLSGDYTNAGAGITSTFNATTNIGSITVGTNNVSYKNIEQLNISGTRYNDLIVGSNGNDRLEGRSGNDTIIGGVGNDILYGGNGTDTFAFNNYNEGVDTINGFNATNELIQVSSAGFGGGLSPSSLLTSQFTIGTSATTSEQRFIYDNSTGGLYFDLDGSASGFTQVKFAQLLGGVTLTENNFVLV